MGLLILPFFRGFPSKNLLEDVAVGGVVSYQRFEVIAVSNWTHGSGMVEEVKVLRFMVVVDAIIV